MGKGTPAGKQPGEPGPASRLIAPDGCAEEALRPPVKDLDIVWARVNGLRTYARASVNPATLTSPLPPVVFVHGLSVSSRYMLPAARQLAPYCRVYVPDLPGTGYSQKPRRVLDIPGLADTLDAWLDAVHIERAVFVGNSLGCQTIANLALRHPERVAAAVFIGPTMDPQASALREFFRLVWDLLAPEPLSFLPVIVMEFLCTGPRFALRTLHYALNDGDLAKYAAMVVPVQVLRGARDPICPECWAEQLVGLLPDARPLVTIPGVAHCLNYSAPAALVRVMLPFLREVAANVTAEEASAPEDMRAAG